MTHSLWIWLTLIGMGILAYLIGSINSSIIITKCMGADIREHGSGNAGATNMLRTYGKGFAAMTFLFDVLKGIAAVLLGMLAEHLLREKLGAADSYALNSIKYLAGIAAVLGHNYPLFFGFRGGKGIATSAAVILLLDWRAGLATVVIALSVMVVTRYVSLGSIVAGIVYPISVAVFCYWVDGSGNIIALIAALLLGLIAVYRHKANLVRLIRGTESKIGQKKKPDASAAIPEKHPAQTGGK